MCESVAAINHQQGIVLSETLHAYCMACQLTMPITACVRVCVCVREREMLFPLISAADTCSTESTLRCHVLHTTRNLTF